MRIFLFLLGVLFVAVGILERCSAPLSRSEEGEMLAKSKCAGCHAFPDPSLLPKSQWQDFILPAMAHFMGRYNSDSQRTALLAGSGLVSREAMDRVYPASPMVSDRDWELITSYYLSEAPASLSTKAGEVTPKISGMFRVVVPPLKVSSPSTVLLRWQAGMLQWGDAANGRFDELGPGFSFKRRGELEQAPVSVVSTSGHHYIAVMGDFSPTDAATGMIVKLPVDHGAAPSVEIDRLQRPVQILRHDWNEDGLPDFLICEFGKFTGSLSWFLAKPGGGYVRQILRQRPGALQAALSDLNGDGKEDVIALFGQADEGIEVFINKGKGTFDIRRVLTFPPSYGSSGLQLRDIDSDGDEDILYTAGDNADFFPVIKPYHGIYYFENKGNLDFRQRWFYAMPGAYGIKTGDFNLDGYLDIAAISFFPDWTHTDPLDFLLLKGTVDNAWQAERLSLSGYGRWIVMESADMDRDGDQDFLLGSLMMEPKPDNGRLKRWLNGQIPFIVLENLTRK